MNKLIYTMLLFSFSIGYAGQVIDSKDSFGISTSKGQVQLDPNKSENDLQKESLELAKTYSIADCNSDLYKNSAVVGTIKVSYTSDVFYDKFPDQNIFQATIKYSCQFELK